MSARHRLTELPAEHLLIERRARRRMSFLVRTSFVILGSAIVAGVLAALVVNAFGAGGKIEATARAEDPLHASLPVHQDGTVIAVSAASMTARSADGYIQTYVLTPDTAVITRTGGQSHGAGAFFTVNDEVTILGTVQNGTVLATALVHRGVAHGDGPPMDYVESGR